MCCLIYTYIQFQSDRCVEVRVRLRLSAGVRWRLSPRKPVPGATLMTSRLAAAAAGPGLDKNSRRRFILTRRDGKQHHLMQGKPDARLREKISPDAGVPN